MSNYDFILHFIYSPLIALLTPLSIILGKNRRESIGKIQE